LCAKVQKSLEFIVYNLEFFWGGSKIFYFSSLIFNLFRTFAADFKQKNEFTKK